MASAQAGLLQQGSEAGDGKLSAAEVVELKLGAQCVRRHVRAGVSTDGGCPATR